MCLVAGRLSRHQTHRSDRRTTSPVDRRGGRRLGRSGVLRGSQRRGAYRLCLCLCLGLASNVVLPQFGKIPGAACTYFELGARAARFPDGLASPLETGQVIAVAYESDCDWVPLERARRETREKRWLDLKPRSHPVNVHNVPGFAAGERAAKTYFDAQRLALSSRHHALCDARTLRIAYEAAAASTARQAESSHLFAGKWQQRPVSSRPHVKTSA